jgi:hypothetical protein
MIGVKPWSNPSTKEMLNHEQTRHRTEVFT